MALHRRPLGSGLVGGGLSRRRLLRGSVLGLTGLAASRWVRPAAAQVQPWGTTYIGQSAEDPGTLVGLVSDGSRVFAYICADLTFAATSQYDQAVVGGDWFHGVSLDGSSLTAMAPSGSMLQLDLSGQVPAGVVQTAGGNTLTFNPDVAAGLSGLFRDQRKDSQGVTFTAGWIVLNQDLNVPSFEVGAIQIDPGSLDTSTMRRQPLAAPLLDPNNSSLAIVVPNLGLTFTPTPVQLLNLQF